MPGGEGDSVRGCGGDQVQDGDQKRVQDQEGSGKGVTHCHVIVVDVVVVVVVVVVGMQCNQQRGADPGVSSIGGAKVNTSI